MTKSELRKKYRLLRSNLSKEYIEDSSLEIANQLLHLPIWSYSFYHTFLTIEQFKEVNTNDILNILSGKDKNIVVSRCEFKTGLMHNYLLTDSTTIKISSFKIPEPVDGIPISNTSIEVVFVPLLAFDLQGNRVGYGKGYYDRFLNDCKPETIKIGLSFFEAEPFINGISEHDVPLDYCVTPNKIYTF